MKTDDSTSIDPIFSNPRLASIYDAFDPDRSDIKPYVALIKSCAIRKVVDLGCGTGVLALQLAKEGFEVIGIDPANASINVAKAKPGAKDVKWVVGDATVLHSNSTDAVVMTGNVAQAITDPKSWISTIRSVKASLMAGGYFIFETRKPEAKAWEDWTKDKSFQSIEVANVGLVDSWVTLTKVSLPLISFRWTYYFHKDNQTITSDSTLRFRTLEEIANDLGNNGLKIIEVREAPDRTGKEFVVIAQTVE
jgi:ubiquinone/menaquinone biosynthesis C-methylase UbiE